VSAGAGLTLALLTLIIGCTAGSMYQTWSAYHRNMEAMTGRYLAEKAWLDARTAEALAELEGHGKAVKEELKSRRTAK